VRSIEPEEAGLQMARTALITGITGQDGSYLTELLLARGYRVHGLVRRASLFNTDRLDHLYQDPHESDRRLFLHYADLLDAGTLRRVLGAADPDEIYHLGAQSHVKVSFDEPAYTADTIALGTLRLLEAVRDHSLSTGRPVRMYNAGSSEMYGSAPAQQREDTPFQPRSPYAVSKVAAHWYAVNYREAYGLFVCNGILFNHESPRRGETFVSRKVTRAAARIKLGLQRRLYLGNLEARRDWGFAGDYVEAMWRMLQRDEPADYVVATGASHTVRDLVETAFRLVELDWKEHVEIDPRYFRPTEVDHLEGDASKARRDFGWAPQVGFEELIRMMVEHDLELAARERTLRDHGHAAVLRGNASP
jgi:GDPmannose 4,6-dehydratase